MSELRKRAEFLATEVMTKAPRTGQRIDNEFVPRKELVRRLLVEALLQFSKEESERTLEEVAKWMISRSFSTGHGDTITDLLDELDAQVTQLRKKVQYCESAMNTDENERYEKFKELDSENSVLRVELDRERWDRKKVAEIEAELKAKDSHLKLAVSALQRAETEFRDMIPVFQKEGCSRSAVACEEEADAIAKTLEQIRSQNGNL